MTTRTTCPDCGYDGCYAVDDYRAVSHTENTVTVSLFDEMYCEHCDQKWMVRMSTITHAVEPNSETVHLGSSPASATDRWISFATPTGYLMLRKDAITGWQYEEHGDQNQPPRAGDTLSVQFGPHRSAMFYGHYAIMAEAKILLAFDLIKAEVREAVSLDENDDIPF